MTIEESAVAGMLRDDLPEYAALVDEHVSEWHDEPLIYLLVGSIFQEIKKMPPGRERALLVDHRVYAFVERMLSEGSDSVRDCFAIEFIEPLSDDASADTYPNFEAALGPIGKRELAGMREWWRKNGAMMAVIFGSKRKKQKT